MDILAQSDDEVGITIGRRTFIEAHNGCASCKSRPEALHGLPILLTVEHQVTSKLVVPMEVRGREAGGPHLPGQAQPRLHFYVGSGLICQVVIALPAPPAVSPH